ILERVRSTWPQANDCEITLEANPGSVEAGRFRGYRDAGVNRVSLGLQALNDPDLRRLGRLHTATEGRAALETAREVFDRVSFDLIYARQDQTLADWGAELKLALTIAPDHLSLYQLTIEDGTAFGDRLKRGGLTGLPGEDLAADFYEITQDLCETAGLPAYEVSNHARPSDESRHNLIYWRAGDYAGVGPGAHGRLTLNGQRWATDTPKQPGAWLQQVETRDNGEAGRDKMDATERSLEYLMMSLRLTEGTSVSRYHALSDNQVELNDISMLCEIGVLNRVDDRVQATRKGRMVLNAVIRALARG
ncbi:MAG: coproporphyrinogen-III oxidase family protein, partial [Paracoccaceae bacterium]|nr:coproporphyrinogen-III oxidase family protein [Paracoccaceae bacterium]